MSCSSFSQGWGARAPERSSGVVGFRERAWMFAPLTVPLCPSSFVITGQCVVFQGVDIHRNAAHIWWKHAELG